MYKLTVNFIFELKSALHSGGDIVKFGVDKAVYLDPVSGKPVIPATSFKGLIRRHVESILKAKNIRVCDAPKPDAMCSETANACIVCRFFGSPTIKSPLIFNDVEILNAYNSIKTSTTISRFRKTVLEDHLFTAQVVSGSLLKTAVTGLFNDKDDCITASALLYIGSASACGIGAGLSRGMGWINFKKYEPLIDDTPLNSEVVNNKIREVLKS